MRWLIAFTCLWYAAAGCVGGSGGSGSTQSTSNGVAVDQSTEVDHILAAGDPPLTIVEYGDFQCPACGAFFEQSLPAIRARYIDTGKVRWIFRHFPLRSIHPFAESAAQAAECAADQGEFWAYHDTLFERQPNLSDEDLKSYAADLGLDQAAFDDCLDSGEKADRVQRDVNSGNDLGISGTPGFLIGDQVIVGALDTMTFGAMIDDLLD